MWFLFGINMENFFSVLSEVNVLNSNVRYYVDIRLNKLFWSKTDRKT